MEFELIDLIRELSAANGYKFKLAAIYSSVDRAMLGGIVAHGVGRALDELHVAVVAVVAEVGEIVLGATLPLDRRGVAEGVRVGHHEGGPTETRRLAPDRARVRLRLSHQRP